MDKINWILASMFAKSYYPAAAVASSVDVLKAKNREIVLELSIALEYVKAVPETVAMRDE